MAGEYPPTFWDKLIRALGISFFTTLVFLAGILFIGTTGMNIGIKTCNREVAGLKQKIQTNLTVYSSERVRAQESIDLLLTTTENADYRAHEDAQKTIERLQQQLLDKEKELLAAARRNTKLAKEVETVIVANAQLARERNDWRTESELVKLYVDDAEDRLAAHEAQLGTCKPEPDGVTMNCPPTTITVRRPLLSFRRQPIPAF